MVRGNGKICSVALAAGLFIVLLAGAAGCGSNDLGKVSGKVTLDGQPLANATLIFTPLTGGSTTAAKTDAAGEYTLIHARGVYGAPLGTYRVWISTRQSADDSDPSIVAVPERVPSKYRSVSALTAEIKPGANKLDFALDSSGATTAARTPYSSSAGTR